MSLAAGLWSLVSGCWSLVTGGSSLATGHWPHVTCCWSLATGRHGGRPYNKVRDQTGVVRRATVPAKIVPEPGRILQSGIYNIEKPGTNNRLPEASNQRPATSDKPPGTRDQRPVTRDQRPATSINFSNAAAQRAILD